MDIHRIRKEIVSARQYFQSIESGYDSQSNPYVRAALQTTEKRIYILNIFFPYGYPNVMPKVYVKKPVLAGHTPHMYRGGNICYQHSSTWNPGRHDLTHVISRTAKWLNKYEVWIETGNWPGKEITH